MKLINGLLNYSQQWELPNIFLFTGNPVIKKNGAIVMGRGAAKQVRDTYPGIDVVFGEHIKRQPDSNVVFTWISDKPNPQYIGWFQVKQHWADPAVPEIIEASTTALKDLAEQNPSYTFHMNYPGVGNGRLSADAIEPIVNQLPDNVWLYR